MKQALIRSVNDKMYFDINTPSGFLALISRNLADGNQNSGQTAVFPANRG